jgi:hypothetical protein
MLEACCVAISLALVLVGFWFPPVFLDLGFSLSAYWYAIAIRWIDNNELWVDKTT